MSEMGPFDSSNESARLGMNIGIAIVTLIFVLGFGYFAYYTWAGPAYEEVRHKTFEHSTAYIQGKVQALNRYRMDYERASKEHRPALARIARHEASTIDRTRLPIDLREWLASLEQTNVEAKR